MDSIVAHLRRAASADTTTFAEDSLDSVPDTSSSSNFDPKVFWSVNAFTFALLIGIVCYGCYGDLSWLTNMHQRRREADAEYQAAVRHREQERKEAKKTSPAVRRRELLASFRRHKVSMVRTIYYVYCIWFSLFGKLRSVF
jgi:hypothetical protein